MRPDRPVSPVRRGAIVLLVAAGVALFAGCTPAPEPSPTSTGDPSPDTSTPGAEPQASPSATVNADISVPIRCEDIYSADMLALLESTNPPLNDEGVTMESTEVAEALEILGSGLQTLRCSWGLPSSYGLATNVTIVDETQARAVLAALEGRGFACQDLADGKVCRQQSTDEENSYGETHYLRGNGWVSTRWINFGPSGYTEDIVSTLWG